jgi:hypothetical protein
MLIIDIMLAMGYALDSISAYTHRNANDNLLLILMNPIAQTPLEWDMLTGADQDPAQALRMMAVRDCNVNRPYLWMLYVPKLWGSLNLLVLGMERILSVSYPLWFKAVRIRFSIF